MDVDEWAQKDAVPEDWRIPLTFTSGAATADVAGTSIKITHLTEEVRTRLRDPALTNDLRSAISKTYLLFLNRYANVSVQRNTVDPWVVPLGKSKDVTPANKDFTFKLDGGTVKVKLIASLAERGDRNEWAYERAGWYVFCNNRAVLAADKSELTGWDAVGMPKYHSKYIGFIGLLFFQSSNPLLLPWRTTKRGVNADSMAYQLIRPEMAAAARPIITFLNEMYPSDIPEELSQRMVAESVRGTDLKSFAKQASTEFSISKPRTRTPSSDTVSIQYNASKKDVDRIKKATRQTRLSASKIGEFTFKHFVEHEFE